MLVCAWLYWKPKLSVGAEALLTTDANVGYHWHLFLFTCPNECTLGSSLCDLYPAEIMGCQITMKAKGKACSARFHGPHVCCDVSPWLVCVCLCVYIYMYIYSIYLQCNNCTAESVQNLRFLLDDCFSHKQTSTYEIAFHPQFEMCCADWAQTSEPLLHGTCIFHLASRTKDGE